MFKSLSYKIRRSFAAPEIKVFTISAKSTEDKKGIYWRHGHENPPHRMDDALLTLLACLAESQHATTMYWARRMGAHIRSIEFHKMEAEYDLRLWKDVVHGQNRFYEVRYEVVIDGDSNHDQIKEIKKKVEEHCPVFGMLRGSGVIMNAVWKKLFLI